MQTFGTEHTGRSFASFFKRKIDQVFFEAKFSKVRELWTLWSGESFIIIVVGEIWLEYLPIKVATAVHCGPI